MNLFSRLLQNKMCFGVVLFHCVY